MLPYGISASFDPHTAGLVGSALGEVVWGLTTRVVAPFIECESLNIVRIARLSHSIHKLKVDQTSS